MVVVGIKLYRAFRHELSVVVCLFVHRAFRYGM